MMAMEGRWHLPLDFRILNVVCMFSLTETERACLCVDV